MTRDFLGYLETISDGTPKHQIAKAAGVSASTITRWDPSRTDHIKPRADAVIAIAQRYGRPPLEALIEAGVLSPEDAGVRTRTRSLSEYSHTALLRELQHRLDGQVSDPSETLSTRKEDPNPDDYDLAAGNVDRPDHDPAD